MESFLRCFPFEYWYVCVMKNLILSILSILIVTSCATVSPVINHNSCVDCNAERNNFWNQWLAVCAPGNEATSLKADWSQTVFRTVGVDYADFIKEDSLDYVAMVGMYDSQESADKYLPGVILSGSDYPNQSVVKKGDYLTKLVKVGANISGFSVYYITPDELQRIESNPSRLEQVLGLPLTSNAGTYLVYKIHALQDNVVFYSHVAPTIQYESPTKVVYWTCGGATQTLVLNNSDAELWMKDSIPSDTLKIEMLPNINQFTELK